MARTQVKSWGFRQSGMVWFRRTIAWSLLLVLLPCTGVRAQENVWLSSHALALLDTIKVGFHDWQKRTKRLHESNLIPEDERQVETKLLAKKERQLLQRTYSYIGAYGFPGKPAKDIDLEAEKKILFRELFAIPETDSLGRAAVMTRIYQLNSPVMERLQAQQILLALLDTERDFDQRCMLIGTLRLEYEKGTYNAHQIFLFLEQTYMILHAGDRLSFDAGTSNTHKLTTYAAELDGCW